MNFITVKDFKVLGLKFSKTSVNPHHIFIKEHSVREYEEKVSPGKTLYVLNVPPLANEESLKNVFSIAGKVLHVILQQRHDKSGEIANVAFIVYTKRDSLLKALKLANLPPLSTEKNPIETGLNKFISEYNQTLEDGNKLQEKVDTFMTNYDKIKEERKRKEQEEQVDEDGWQIVTKKGRRPGLAKKQSLEDNILKNIKLKTTKKELKNFYPFQIRENKLKTIKELKNKYEKEKKKIEDLKKLRKFKPY